MSILVKLRNWLWPKFYPVPKSNYQSLSIGDKSIHDKSLNDVDHAISDFLNQTIDMVDRAYPLKSPPVHDTSMLDKSMEDFYDLINEMLDLLNRIDYLKYELRNKIENGDGNGAK